MSSQGITAKRNTWTIPSWLGSLLVLVLAVSAAFLLRTGLEQTHISVSVGVDGRNIEVRTHAITVEGVLRQAGLELYPEDLVSPRPETPTEPGMSIQVRRARPVLVSADGQTFHARTQAETVGELLEEVGRTIRPADEILLNDLPVSFDTPLDSTGRTLKSGGSLTRTDGPGQMSLRSLVDEAAGAGSDPLPVITLHRATTLTLEDAGIETVLHSTATTVGQVLHENGLTVFLGDRVTPALKDRITPGLRITVQRSVPVQIEVDGRTVRTRTLADTVAGVLGQEGIALLGMDRSEPGLSEPIKPEMIIRVTRVREEFVVEFDPIPFETVWVPDPEVEIDNIRLAQEGQVGLNKRRYRVVYENNREVARILEDNWAEQPPIAKTMAYGTKIVVRTAETPDGPIEYWRKMRVYTTSYTAATCGKPRDHPRYGYTRLGKWLTKGIVAVDPTVIPLKTRLYVPGYGHAFAGDTGGGVKGKFVDLGFDEWNYQSWHWWTDIYVLTPVPPPDQIRWILPDMPRFPDRHR